MFGGRDVRFMQRVAEATGVRARRLHRDLHLRLPAALLREPRRGRDRRALRRRHREGHPGHRHQGRVPQVRGRRARASPSNVEKLHRAVRARQPADRRADHGPLAAGVQHRPAPGRDLPRGGRRPGEDPDRPHRRHRRPRLHRGPARQRRVDRPGPLRPGRCSCRTTSATRRPPSCCAAATPTGCSSPRTSARPSTGSRRRPVAGPAWTPGLVRNWSMTLVFEEVVPWLREQGVLDDAAARRSSWTTRAAGCSADGRRARRRLPGRRPVARRGDGGCLARIERRDPELNAFCLVDAEGALADARGSEARWARGEPAGPLDGVPVGVKDLFLTRGWPTLRGSQGDRRRPARGSDDAPVGGRAAPRTAPCCSARRPRRSSAGRA